MNASDILHIPQFLINTVLIQVLGAHIDRLLLGEHLLLSLILQHNIKLRTDLLGPSQSVRTLLTFINRALDTQRLFFRECLVEFLKLLAGIQQSRVLLIQLQFVLPGHLDHFTLIFINRRAVIYELWDLVHCDHLVQPWVHI